MHPVNSAADDGIRRQKYLGGKGLIGLIAFLSAFVPLSTDLYLPALPGMAKYFGVPASAVNLTLILFFLFFSIGMLFWGPLSDKYGRRPILIGGLILYAAASVLCACAGTVHHLIAARILQAAGAGAACAVATATVKDVYEVRKRETILAMVQSMVVLAPALAPILGAFLLKFTSWRGAFWTQAGIGVLALAGALVFEETIRTRYTGTLLQTAGRLGVVLKNPGFTFLLFVFPLTSIPGMAYIASSSYIYQDEFGLSQQWYSYFFGANGLFLMVGPVLYVRLSGHVPRRIIINTCFGSLIASGLSIGLLGRLSPWIFAVSLLPTTIAGSCARPPGVNLMLEQQQEDTGSAAALMGCFGLLAGSLGMFLISLDWRDIIFALGILNVATGLTCLTLWLLFSGKPFIVQVPERRAARSSHEAPGM